MAAEISSEPVRPRLYQSARPMQLTTICVNSKLSPGLIFTATEAEALEI